MSYLKQMLMWKIISRVQLKDQHMIDTRLPPAISVNPQEEEKLNQQETAAVDAHQWPDVLITNEKSTWEGKISHTAGLSTRLYKLLHCSIINESYNSRKVGIYTLDKVKINRYSWYAGLSVQQR